MKIAAGLVAVLLVLLGMIAAVGYLDDSIAFGDPPQVVNSADDGSPVTGVERAYIEFVVGVLQTTSNDINSLGVIFSQPDFEDDFWRSSATVLLNRIEMSYGALSPLEPSPRLQPFQDASVAATEHSGNFARIIRELFQQGRAELTDEAAWELIASAEAFDEAETLLTEFLEAHPLD